MLCRIILETDASVIAGKVASHSVDSGAPLSEQVHFFVFSLLSLVWINDVQKIYEKIMGY